MKKNNKIIIMIITIISVILLVSAGTMAYWYWSGLDQAQNLVVNIAGIKNSDIIYDEGNSHFVGDFKPTSDYYKSIGTTIKFRKSQRVKDYSLLATVHLDVNALGTNMSESNDIHWVVTTGNSTDSWLPFFSADVNFDGEADNKDVGIIYNYAKDHMSDGDILYGDVAEPYGVVDIEDANTLLLHTSMPDIFPLDDSVVVNADVDLSGYLDNDDVLGALSIVNGYENGLEIPSLPSNTDDILYGDVNLDGKVTTYDYAYLIRYITFQDTYPLCNSSDKVLNTGTFKGVSSGETIDILENIEVTTEDQVFTVWVWLDSNGEGTADLSGETIDTSVWTEITMYNAADTGNVPVLDKGMIPVTIADDGTVTTVSPSDPDWYNYNEKRWANVVLVNENATEGVANSHSRSYYKTNIGEEVTQDDILAYYVWIPRYKYKMPQTKCSSIKNPTMADNPECYAPYTLTAEEKNALVKYRSDEALCEGSYGEEQINAESTKDIELGLSTGRLSNGTSIISYIEEYNNAYIENNGYTFCMGEGLDVSEITLTASEFNGNITYTTKEGTIDISFESASESMSLRNAKTEYRTHPAFWWDNDNDNIVDTREMLPGIWVGKFETTPDKSSTCYTTVNLSNCNNATQNATILPNAISLRYQTVSNQFATSQNFSKSGNIYGLSNTSTNAHMMKNSEWGAVAYLSHSVYGINGEIYINNNSKYYTGRSGGSTSVFDETYGTYTWLGQTIDNRGNIGTYAADRTLGTNASTTGNVTGIYDMSGGAYENVMGRYGYAIGMEWGYSKYYDLYSEEEFLGTSYGNLAYCTIESCGGHALNETVGWYNDYAPFFVGSVSSWLRRGGFLNEAQGAGAFGFIIGSDGANGNCSWRSVVVPGFGA